MTIENDDARQRFTIQLDAGEAYLSYTRPRPGVIDLRHTVVPEAGQGQGVGTSLVRFALDYAREHGEQVIPTCPFVESWLDSHPDDADVVAER